MIGEWDENETRMRREKRRMGREKKENGKRKKGEWEE
jgi:hypothetical protein